MALAKSFEACFNGNLLLCIKGESARDFRIQAAAFDEDSGVRNLLSQSEINFHTWLARFLIRVHTALFIDERAHRGGANKVGEAGVLELRKTKYYFGGKPSPQLGITSAACMTPGSLEVI